MQGPPDIDHRRISYRDIKVPDGARSLESELGEDLWSLGGSSYLVLPSDRLVKELVRSRSAGTSDRVITVKRLAGHLYDLLGGTSAVRVDLFREAAVARIMESPDIVRLRPEGGGTRGMARHVAEVIKELLVNCRSPMDLNWIASTGRSRELTEIYSRYIAMLRSTGSVDVEEIPSIVADLIEEDPSKLSGLIFGIYMPGKLDRSYSRMLTAILGSCHRAKVLDHEVRGPPEFMGGGYARRETSVIPPPGSRARETVRWPMPISTIHGEDRITSLRAVCRHIKHLVLEERMEPGDIAIVIPGGSLHERYLPTVLTEFGIPYSMDREVHASEVPAVSGMIGLLSLPSDEWRSMKLAEHLTAISGRFSPDDGEGVTGPELSIAFTQVPVFGGPDPEEAWVLPMRRYLDEGGRSERARSICERAIPALKTLLGWIKAMSVLRTDPREFVSEVRSFISFVKLSVLGPEVSEVRDEALHKLDRAVARVPTICPDLEAAMDLSSFLDMLDLCLSKDKIELAENGEGVWVGKIKQQAGRASKVVILHSMTDMEYPLHSSDFRLLASEERSALSLRERPDRREALEDLAVCLGSGEVPIISLHRTEVDRPVSISTMLEGVDLVEIDVGDDPRSRMEKLRLAACSHEDRHLQEDGKVRIVDPSRIILSLEGGKDIWERISARKSSFGEDDGPFRGRILDQHLLGYLSSEFGPECRWSASKLETYRKCPYEFFIKYVLGILPLERLDPDIPPDRKGLIIHAILEGFYGRLKAKGKARVIKGEEEDAYTLMVASAREVISSYAYNGPFWEAISDLLLGMDGERGLLREFIDTEAAYEGPLTVEGMEVAFGNGSSASVEGTEGSLLMEGIVDRIDRADDMRMVWDYKTGSSRNFKAKENLQVPLYLAALRALHTDWVPAGGGYYWVGNRGEVRKELVHGNDMDPASALMDVQRYISKSVDEALDMIGSIRSGSFPPTKPCPKRTYCELADICRRDES